MYRNYPSRESFGKMCLFLQWRHLKIGPRTKEFILFALWCHHNCCSSGAKNQVEHWNKLSHCCYGSLFSCNRGSLLYATYVQQIVRTPPNSPGGAASPDSVQLAEELCVIQVKAPIVPVSDSKEVTFTHSFINIQSLLDSMPWRLAFFSLLEAVVNSRKGHSAYFSLFEQEFVVHWNFSGGSQTNWIPYYLYVVWEKEDKLVCKYSLQKWLKKKTGQFSLK